MSRDPSQNVYWYAVRNARSSPLSICTSLTDVIFWLEQNGKDVTWDHFPEIVFRSVVYTLQPGAPMLIEGTPPDGIEFNCNYAGVLETDFDRKYVGAYELQVRGKVGLGTKGHCRLVELRSAPMHVVVN